MQMLALARDSGMQLQRAPVHIFVNIAHNITNDWGWWFVVWL
jgi:hypothetical protein